MNIKHLQHDDSASSILEVPVLPERGMFSAIIARAIFFLSCGCHEQSRARYRAKREQAALAKFHQKSAGSLSGERKLGLEKYLTYGLIEWR